MKSCFVILLPVLAAAPSLAQPKNSLSTKSTPETAIRRLYTEYVSRDPQGVPNDADMRAFAPYLSRALLHKIGDAKACDADWRRNNPDPTLQPPGLGYGLLSGGGIGGITSPRSFKIDSIGPRKDGSYRVHLTLSRTWPSWGLEEREVIPIVVQEDGGYVVDDVTYPPGEERDSDPPLSAYLAAGCDGPRWIGFGGQHDGAARPEVLVRSLYQQVVARKPGGIPWGIDQRIFTPYLSNALLHRINTAAACAEDWDRQDEKRMMMKGEVIEKPPFAWLECGLFTGDDDRTGPNAFVIERTEPKSNGSVRVYLKLTGGAPPDTPWSWRVAAVVVRENGHSVLEDVIYLKDDYLQSDRLLSERLASGCNGPHWVGYGDRQNGPKPNQK